MAADRPVGDRIPALAGGQGLLGQVTGRTSAAVIEWLSARGPAFRAAVQVVALDPSAPYAAAVRAALPHRRTRGSPSITSTWSSSPNDAVTRVRRRVTLEVHGRCGRKSDPAWANRRRLLADWIAKELLRELLACACLPPARTQDLRPAAPLL